MIPIDRQILKKLTVYFPDNTPVEISDYLTDVSIDYGDTTGIGVSGADGVVPVMSFSLKNDTNYRFNPLDKNSPVNFLNQAYIPLLWENRRVLFEARIMDTQKEVYGEFIGTGDGSTKDFYLDYYPVLDLLHLPLKSVEYWTYAELDGMSYTEMDGMSWYKSQSDYAGRYAIDNTDGKISFQESVPNGVNLICPVYAYWRNDTGWKKRFRGYLGDEIRNTPDGVSCTCRSTSKLLMDCFIETERQYGDAGGKAAEEVIQQIIDDNLGEDFVTLYCPISPGFMVLNTEASKISYMSVWDAIQKIAGMFGWFLGDYYNSTTNEWYLTLVEPPRLKDSGTADLFLDYRPDIYVEELNITGKNIRNVINVVYKDKTTGARNTVTVTDEDSIAAYGRRTATFEESDTSMIDTEAEATAFGNAALSDLSSLSGAYRIEIPLLFDVNLFTGMVIYHPRIHTDNQFFAVASMRESYSFGDSPQFRTEALGSGKVTGGLRRWLDMEARPGANRPTVPPGMSFTTDGVSNSSGVILSDSQGRIVDPTGAVIADSGGFNGKTITSDILYTDLPAHGINLGTITIPTGKKWVIIVNPIEYGCPPDSNSEKTLKRIHWGTFLPKCTVAVNFSPIYKSVIPAGTHINTTVSIVHNISGVYYYTDDTSEEVIQNYSVYYEIREIQA